MRGIILICHVNCIARDTENFILVSRSRTHPKNTGSMKTAGMSVYRSHTPIRTHLFTPECNLNSPVHLLLIFWGGVRKPEKLVDQHINQSPEKPVHNKYRGRHRSLEDKHK